MPAVSLKIHQVNLLRIALPSREGVQRANPRIQLEFGHPQTSLAAGAVRETLQSRAK